ncbi:MAG: GGDEF domain-containing protein [Betaproteobacteria bacterium]|nr:MAG: GGDEF domain-containing protein [Betaproteobacteria bacterium]
MFEPTLDISAPTKHRFRQRLRLRRFLLASAFSALYLVVLAIFYTQGSIAGQTLLDACAIVAAFILAFFGIFRLGLNLRFPDPSLTGWQFLAAMATMLYVVYHAPDTRIAFTAFFFVALMFGMLRHSGAKLAVLGSISLIAFALAIWLRYLNNEDAEMLRLDVLQIIVLALTFPWFVFIGGRVKRLQRGLTEASIKLEDVEEKSRHDDLTGVYNRRALIAAMEASKQRADIAAEALSICVIDLDFFKRYNDEFDHLTGDQVLRAFAEAVQSGLRATDIFGRYGGEEFVQILRHTTLEGAMADAERLRERIGLLDIRVPGRVGQLTVSIGVAQYRPGEAIIETFARADGALHRAKQRGRNRVEC